jgi:hypothetical protein
MGDDIASEPGIARSFSKGRLGRDRPCEIFVRDSLETVLNVLLERITDIDLMTRNPDIHVYFSTS